MVTKASGVGEATGVEVAAAAAAARQKAETEKEAANAKVAAEVVAKQAAIKKDQESAKLEADGAAADLTNVSGSTHCMFKQLTGRFYNRILNLKSLPACVPVGR